MFGSRAAGRVGMVNEALFIKRSGVARAARLQAETRGLAPNGYHCSPISLVQISVLYFLAFFRFKRR